MIKNWTDLWDGERYRVQTKHGREVRIWTIDAYCTPEKVHGEYRNLDGEWIHCNWFWDGRFFLSKGSDLDLVPIPRKVKRWGPLRSIDNHVPLYCSEEKAKEMWPDQCIATVEWEE